MSKKTIKKKGMTENEIVQHANSVAGHLLGYSIPPLNKLFKEKEMDLLTERETYLLTSVFQVMAMYVDADNIKNQVASTKAKVDKTAKT